MREKVFLSDLKFSNLIGRKDCEVFYFKCNDDLAFLLEEATKRNIILEQIPITIFCELLINQILNTAQEDIKNE